MSDEIYTGQDWRAQGVAEIDVSAASPLVFKIQKGDDTNVIKDGTATPGEALKAYVDLTPSDMNVGGYWYFQMCAKVGSHEYKGKIWRKWIHNAVG